MSRFKRIQAPRQQHPCRRRIFAPSALVLALSGALAMPGMVLAADWTGNVSNDWLAGGNWSTGVPGAADDVFIDTAPSPVINGAGSNGLAKNVFVGNTSSGSLSILNAAQLNSGSGLIGFAAGTSGQAAVGGMAGGVGASWISTSMNVGIFGSGTLAVFDGGLVSTSASAFIGVQAGGSGVVSVDGPGSGLTIGTTFLVGNFGSGTLTVSKGGVVKDTQGIVANQPNSSGAATVDGAGSTWTSTADLSVGRRGLGTLGITNGGVVGNVNGMVGQYLGEGSGAVTVDGAGSLWTSSGNLKVGDGGQGSLMIANGGTVTAKGLLTVAQQAGSAGLVLIGGFPAPAAPGLLNTATVQFGAGDGALLFNHTDTSGNYAFAPAVSGLGTLIQNAGWTNLTGNSSGFTGLTHINGGRLAVNGSLAGSLVDVNNGGTLGGSGSVAGITANAGATVAPGNSIGTLTVMGNVSQAAGSIYEVELNAAGQSDLIKAAGTATIEAGALLKPINYGLAPLVVGTRYTVLQADGGVSGQYSLLGGSNFLNFAASYDATHAYLDVAQVKSFAQAGLTANQKAAGAGAESLGSGALYSAILMSPTDTAARYAFDRISGEVHASARAVQLEGSHFARDASLERLRAMDSEAVANDGGADGEARLLPSVRDLAYWARAMGSWGHIDGDNGSATVKRDTSGFLMGADTRFGEEGRFGLMGGYSRSSFDVTDRNSSGSSENYHLGAYAGSRWGDLALRTGISYSWHDVSTSRSVAFPGFTDSLKADYKASTTQAFAELGYRIKTAQAEYEPFVNIANVNVSSDGFTERGGAAALSSAGNSSGVTFATVGLRASTSFDMNNGTSVTARGSLGWRGASGDIAPTTTLAFAGGSPFAVAGAPIAKSAAVVEAGFDFRLSNAATLGVSYGGQFGSGLKDHSARIHLNVAF